MNMNKNMNMKTNTKPSMWYLFMGESLTKRWPITPNIPLLFMLTRLVTVFEDEMLPSMNNSYFGILSY